MKGANNVNIGCVCVCMCVCVGVCESVCLGVEGVSRHNLRA